MYSTCGVAGLLSTEHLYQCKHKYKYVTGNNKINAWKQDANHTRVTVAVIQV